MTPELQAVVEDAYRVFAPYTIGSALVVCNCPMCMDKEDERALCATPLTVIPSRLLAEYTSSAHEWDDGQVAREMRHFLPRYLELIAEGDPPDNMGLDICLRRLGQARWRSLWLAAETDVLDRFLDALMRSAIERVEGYEWPVGYRLDDGLRDVLTLIVTAGGDIGRALSVWEQASDPNAAIHMAALRNWVLQESGRTYLCSAYLDEHRDAADVIGRFLVQTEVDRRIEAAFFMVDDPRIQKALSDAVWR